jgi:hypothetical protein
VNPVEIDEAISVLAGQEFDAAEFPFAFLEAFGNKPVTIKKLRKGTSNSSDIDGGVLQRLNIHIAVCAEGDVNKTLSTLEESPATAKAKAKFILATDGIDLVAEEIKSGDTIACAYNDFPNHFGFFLPLAGITTTKQIRDNPIDIQATSRLNRLYVELLETNEDWASAERREDMNHFMARLVFCFFAEDTDIFKGSDLFTTTVEQMSDSKSTNTHEIISELFRALNTDNTDRADGDFRPWANAFPYVNGGLFAGSCEVPKFSRIARSYLLHAGSLDWQQINPDIFGSMIQAVADDEERGSLGMHYTSVANILKLLNPLFLDGLCEQLDEAGDNERKLLNLRKRIAKIRVFDPACGSGNFLVIAYKEMRKIEFEINNRRGETHQKSQIPLTNYRGIELRSFPAEIARLALIIAEFQCDVLYLGQKNALKEFLPLNAMNWVTCGNALKLDWLSVCPPTGTSVKLAAEDLFETPLDQSEIDFDNEGGETYICGNPPYLGSTYQSPEQKSDLEAIFKGRTKKWKLLDFVAAWFVKASDYGIHTNAAAAFVSTNSICQGQQVALLWPLIFSTGHVIEFAHTSFKWSNLASHNAGVTVVIVGISNHPSKVRRLFSTGEDNKTITRNVDSINAYLTSGVNIIVHKQAKPISFLSEMRFGNKAVDGGHLLLSENEVAELGLSGAQRANLIRKIYGAAEFIRGIQRFCLWIENKDLDEAKANNKIFQRIEAVKEVRLASRDKGANDLASRPHQLREMDISDHHTILIPSVSSERRSYLACGLFDNKSAILAPNLAIYDAPLWNIAILSSLIHMTWVKNICGQLETRLRYSCTLGWNTFPIPKLTEKNKTDLTGSAEGILLAREAHFPTTIADLYNSETMPENLRQAHLHNDELLERIYIGRLFKNDTERLEKLFELYTKMTSPKNALEAKLSAKGAQR